MKRSPKSLSLPLTLLVPAALGSAATACADADPDAAEQDANTSTFSSAPALPNSAFEQVGTIALEENDEVVNVSPSVSVQDDGSFLIADGREARIRVYDSDGGLVSQFGRKGDGPGELGWPSEAMRRPDGSLLVVDRRGILHFDSTGTQALRESQPPIRPLYTAAQIDDDLFLVAGLRRGSSDPRHLLHVWDAEADSVLYSFFPTPGDSLARMAARNFGWADFARRGDTIAAIAAFADTVYLFDHSGRDLGSVQLPITDYRYIESYDPTASPDVLDKWLEDLDLLVHLHWLDDGTFLVQYQQPRKADNEWSLVRAGPDGRRYFDLRNTPKLLTVHGDLLFFVDPSSLTPDKWIVARLR